MSNLSFKEWLASIWTRTIVFGFLYLFSLLFLLFGVFGKNWLCVITGLAIGIVTIGVNKFSDRFRNKNSNGSLRDDWF